MLHLDLGKLAIVAANKSNADGQFVEFPCVPGNTVKWDHLNNRAFFDQ